MLTWALAGLGLVVLVIRRRSIAVAVVTAQSLVLVAVAALAVGDVNEWLAAAALAARTVGLGTFFILLITRTREPRLVRADIAPLRRGGTGVATAMLLIWLVPDAGLTTHATPDTTQGAVLALVAFGLIVAATRQATLFQILGVVLVENALVLAALQLPGTSWLIEVGVAVDLTLIGLVAGVFHQRIFTEFGAGDTKALRSLRD
jgi:hydrogenase-4 component E